MEHDVVAQGFFEARQRNAGFLSRHPPTGLLRCRIGSSMPVHRFTSDAFFMTLPNSAITYQLQVPEEICRLIDRAAATASKSRADFMLNALLDVAQSALLEQSLFRVSDEQMEAFEQALEQPLDENLAFQKFLARKAPWKR